MNKNKTLFYVLAIISALCFVCLVSIIAINSSEKTFSKSVDEYMQEYGGDPNMYANIISLTDCTSLQEKFDQAEKNLANQTPGTSQYKWGLGYMEASNDRMKELGCYK